jgi:hypothetical protein
MRITFLSVAAMLACYLAAEAAPPVKSSGGAPAGQKPAGGAVAPAHSGGTAAPAHSGGTAAPAHNGGTVAPAHGGGTAAPAHSGGGPASHNQVGAASLAPAGFMNTPGHQVSAGYPVSAGETHNGTYYRNPYGRQGYFWQGAWYQCSWQRVGTRWIYGYGDGDDLYAVDPYHQVFTVFYDNGDDWVVYREFPTEALADATARRLNDQGYTTRVVYYP